MFETLSQKTSSRHNSPPSDPVDALTDFSSAHDFPQYHGSHGLPSELDSFPDHHLAAKASAMGEEASFFNLPAHPSSMHALEPEQGLEQEQGQERSDGEERADSQSGDSSSMSMFHSFASTAMPDAFFARNAVSSPVEPPSIMCDYDPMSSQYQGYTASGPGPLPHRGDFENSARNFAPDGRAPPRRFQAPQLLQQQRRQQQLQAQQFMLQQQQQQQQGVPVSHSARAAPVGFTGAPVASALRPQQQQQQAFSVPYPPQNSSPSSHAPHTQHAQHGPHGGGLGLSQQQSLSQPSLSASILSLGSHNTHIPHNNRPAASYNGNTTHRDMNLRVTGNASLHALPPPPHTYNNVNMNMNTLTHRMPHSSPSPYGPPPSHSNSHSHNSAFPYSSSSLPHNNMSSPPYAPPSHRTLPAHNMNNNMNFNGEYNTMPPNAQNNSSFSHMQGRIYQVQFKCAHRYFTLSTPPGLVVSVGDMVIVDADRGEDLGVVTDILPMKTFVERRIYQQRGAAHDDDESVIGRIIRLASPSERQLLPEKYREEESVLQLCRELAYNTYHLPMRIHDVDYQFDRHKLTIYYSSESRVDFREFVRDLFSAYKARIWMKKLNLNKPLEIEQWAVMSLATGMQFSPETGKH